MENKLEVFIMILSQKPLIVKSQIPSTCGSDTQEKVMSDSAITSLGVRASLAPASTKSRTLCEFIDNVPEMIM